MKTSGFTVRGITFSAMFAALLVALSFVNIQLGISPVPITLVNFVIMLSGALLGPKYGFFSVFSVVLLTALGLPLLHGAGGPTLLFGPTGGFIWAYPFAALFIGWIIRHVTVKGIAGFLLVFFIMLIFGSGLLYVTGVPWLAHSAQISLGKALVLGCYPYLIGDAIKAFASAVIVQNLFYQTGGPIIKN
jgi:biotin transport system substrate-specific component